MGKLDGNKDRNDEDTNLELAKRLITSEGTDKIEIAQSNCTCKRTKCERHGNCEECIAHHKEKETKYLPYCMREKKKKKTIIMKEDGDK